MSLLISNKGELPEFKAGSSTRNAFDLEGCIMVIKYGKIWDADIGSKITKDISITKMLSGSRFAAVTMMPPCWYILCKEGVFKKQPNKTRQVKLFLKKLREQGGDLITVNELSFVAKNGYKVYFDGYNCGVDVSIFPDKKVK